MRLVVLILVGVVGGGLLLRAQSSTAPPAGIPLDGDPSKPMPAIGFGTCCRKSAKGQPLITSTKEFLRQGGRLIDTAQMYKNHKDLAVAVRESGVPRAEIWITSKVNTQKVSTREGTKQATLIAMLRAPDGATIAEIMDATGWQSHTVRGAMSGALKKKLGLEVTSEKVEDRGRVYKLPAA